MKRFYFHLHDCGAVVKDDEGTCYTDADAAREAATAAARDIMAHDVRAGRLCLSCHIDVVSAEGERIARIPFAEVVAVIGRDALR